MATKLKALVKGGALTLALGMGGAVALPASEAHATFRCVAVGVNFFGDRIRGTRATADRVSERRACRAALRRCRARLDEVRYSTGRPRPLARCEIVRAFPIGRGGGGGYGGGGGGYSGGYCNFRACDARYRSFRASDCTFQPYHGPRRRCTL